MTPRLGRTRVRSSQMSCVMRSCTWRRRENVSLAEPDDASSRDVTDGHLAEEGQHVVLAQGIELDVLDDDDFAALVLEDGTVDDGVGVLVVAACVLDERFGGAHGRLGQTFAFWVFTDEFDDGAVVFGYFFGEADVLVAEFHFNHCSRC